MIILNIPTTAMNIDSENSWVLETVTNILIEVLGSIAEEERLKIRRRQTEGIQYPKSRKKPPKFYGSEELDMLLEAMDKYPPESKYKLFVYIMITTGLRKGEILGLEWKNIDLDNGELSIVQSAKYSRKRGMYLGVPKTDTSVRKVRVPKEVVEMLRQYKAEQDEYILNMGSAWEYNDLLFTQYDGKLMSIQTPYEWLKGFYEKHSLPFKGIHASRHSFASEMIANKMDIIKVSRTLGHSMPSTTVNTPKGHTPPPAAIFDNTQRFSDNQSRWTFFFSPISARL
ncbi:Phage integrase family protein [Ruminococcus sp. YE71]|uniref:site-specific integrase n=1 Tax=unclassified Ruminococcus TaxID=2608920 RepID=UPI000886EBEF|nr:MULTISPECIES: site-specific integrase [unclassified Ruminococcus]SDA24827.1 Phage integrase family protein [Ruminococcus sp. YE78]SFW43427.1 Phage integrase family protein [Ruminococcus sp. YE71]